MDLEHLNKTNLVSNYFDELSKIRDGVRCTKVLYYNECKVLRRRGLLVLKTPRDTVLSEDARRFLRKSPKPLKVNSTVGVLALHVKLENY